MVLKKTGVNCISAEAKTNSIYENKFLKNFYATTIADKMLIRKWLPVFIKGSLISRLFISKMVPKIFFFDG